MKYGDRRGATALRLLMIVRSLQRAPRLRTQLISEHDITERTMRRDMELIEAAGFVVKRGRDDEGEEVLRLVAR